jgi:hypothetical protein
VLLEGGRPFLVPLGRDPEGGTEGGTLSRFRHESHVLHRMVTRFLVAARL